MKKTNLLLVFASIIFALCVSSFADENNASLTPKQKLAANIEKYAAEKEITDSLQASWEYHRTSPKEEWLPIWKEILLNGSLAESVTNWLDFAKYKFYFFNADYLEVPEVLSLASEFKELCAKTNHFTLNDFSDALLKIQTDDNCCYPACTAFVFYPKDEQKKIATRNSYHFFSVGDVLKILGLKNESEKILLDKLEKLEKGDYREFSGNSLGKQCLGDITSFGFNKIPIKNDIVKKWWEMWDFALMQDLKDVFMKELENFANIQTNCFFVAKFYCEHLDDKDKAKEFLQKNFPFDKICTMTEAYPDYCRLRLLLEDPLRGDEKPDPLFKYIYWQLYSDPTEFCRNAKWFWEGEDKSRYALLFDSYADIKKRLAKPMLENVKTSSFPTVRRLCEISDKDDFMFYLRKRYQKQEDFVCALYLASLTDDSDEFVKCLKTLSSMKDQVGISCLILNLRDDFPAICANDILDMIKRSDIRSNPDFPYYAEKLKKWCLARNVPEAAAEINEILKSTEQKEQCVCSDPQSELEKIIDNEIGISSVLSKEEAYYCRHQQSEWLPLWKRILAQGDLSQTVSNWLFFAKFPMGYLKNDGGIVKRELKDRLMNRCEENKEFSFSEFVKALVSAPMGENSLYSSRGLRFVSRPQSENMYNELTYYEIADVLLFLDLTNEIPRVAERVMNTLELNKKNEESNNGLYEALNENARWRVSNIPTPISTSFNSRDSWAAFCFCRDCKAYDSYEKAAVKLLKEHPDAIFLLEQYCSHLVEIGKGEEAWEFIKTNYPPEKIYPIPGASVPYYNTIGKVYGYMIDKLWGPDMEERFEKAGLNDFKFGFEELVENCVRAQLENDPESFLRASWFWGEYINKEKIAREVVQPYLAALPKQDMLTLRRLGQISETNWFKAFVKEGWEKDKSVPFAIEEACLTEDPQEFAELLSFIAKEGCPVMGDIPFLTRKLNDDSPVSCADDMMTLIEKSGILDNKSYIGYLDYFCVWCVKKGRKDIADKITSLK
ncbi:hypothetical protein IKZ40_03660 [bacterium]|nr:hypothetical protein [bacterium]